MQNSTFEYYLNNAGCCVYHAQNLTHLDVSENSIEKLDVSALHELQSARCARNALTELTLCGRNLVSLIAGNNSKRTVKLKNVDRQRIVLQQLTLVLYIAELKKLTIEPIPTNLEHLDVS